MKVLHKKRGFTLLEMTVSIGLFTIIFFIATSAFLSIVNADRKSRATHVAMDNLNLALEDMTRKIKTGTKYYCGIAASGANDCVDTPGEAFSFTGIPSSVRTIYKMDKGASCGEGYATLQGCIMRSDNGGSTYVAMTSSEIDIKTLTFLVSGSYPWGIGAGKDKKQPAVTIVINGVVGENSPNSTGKSEFKVQATVVQLDYDRKSI